MYAGFMKRFLAVLLDGIIVGILIGIFLYLASVFGFSGYSADYNRSLANGAIKASFQFNSSFIFIAVITWLYFALMESSKKQSTFGKRAIGIKVTTLDGNRISFGRATGRYFSKILSSIFYIGYIMALFTEKKQGLHDMIAGCLVVNNEFEYSAKNNISNS